MAAEASFDFSGSRIVIIGASRGGIGASIARAFQQAGGDVEITGAEPECVPEDAGRFRYTQLDVTEPDAVEEFSSSQGIVDVLVNCAAITRRGAEMEPGFFSRVLDINLTGSFRCALAMHPALAAARGRLINIVSMYARFGSPRNPAYGASKAGVEQMTKSLAIAWAEHGIRVNAVSPGPFVSTGAADRLWPSEAMEQQVLESIPMGRFGTAEEVGELVCMLASHATPWITGAVWIADGGWSLPRPMVEDVPERVQRRRREADGEAHS